MKEWFMSGGAGMFVILLIGLGAIGLGLSALRDPSTGKLAALRSLPSLIALSALFAFGTNLWAVNLHLGDEAFVKAQNFGDKLPFMAVIGVTEAAQALTLGGLCAMVVVALRIAAEVRAARRPAGAAAGG